MLVRKGVVAFRKGQVTGRKGSYLIGLGLEVIRKNHVTVTLGLASLRES